MSRTTPRFCLLLACGVASLLANAADAPKGPGDWRLAVAENVSNPDAKDATINYTAPDEGKSTYSARVGISAISPSFQPFGEGPTASNWNFRLGPEFAKNTAITKKQDSRALTAAMSGTWPITVGKSGLLPQLAFTAQEDQVANRNRYRLVADTGFSVIDTPFGNWWPNRINNVPGGPIDLNIRLRGGLFYERIQDSGTPSDHNTNGIVLRTEVRVIPNVFNDHVVLNAMWQRINEQYASNGVAEQNYTYREYCVTYYFQDPLDPEVTWKAGIGLSRISGSDPWQGLASQSFNQLQLKIKY